MLTPDDRAKLYWRCRRGMLELDAFLIPFFERYFDTLTESQQQIFARLLEQEDQSLWRWFLGYETCSNLELANLILFIKEKIATPQIPT